MKVIYLVILFTIISCKRNRDIYIIGNVSGIPSKTVYLIPSRDSKHPIDSAEYKDGKFKFVLPSEYEREAVSIIYYLENKRFIKLMFKNHQLGTGGTSTFWMDQGETIISGAWKPDATFFNVPRLNIDGGIDNQRYQKYVVTSYWRNPRVIKKEIRRTPGSYYLLQTVVNNIESYSPKELNEIINLFTKRLRTSDLGRRADLFIQNRFEPGKPFKKFLMTSPLGVKVSNIHAKKVNMIIFWASWCVPCRQETPQLKEIYKENKNKDFHQVSVSVDTDHNNWSDALLKENMTWPQFIINDGDLLKVQAMYEFSSIPLIVFTNKSGIEVGRFFGFENSHANKYQDLINKQLKQ